MASEMEKILKDLPVGYIEDMVSADPAKLRDEIVKADARAAEIKREMKADEKLAGAREIVKDLSGGYRDALKAQAAKVAWCLHELDEKGQPVDTGSEEPVPVPEK